MLKISEITDKRLLKNAVQLSFSFEQRIDPIWQPYLDAMAGLESACQKLKEHTQTIQRCNDNVHSECSQVREIIDGYADEISQSNQDIMGFLSPS